MPKPISDWHKKVIDTVDCDPDRRGCVSKKGDRCKTDSGKLAGYPHTCRVRDFDRQEVDKKRVAEHRETTKALKEGRVIVVDSLTDMQREMENQIAEDYVRAEVPSEAAVKTPEGSWVPLYPGATTATWVPADTTIEEYKERIDKVDGALRIAWHVGPLQGNVYAFIRRMAELLVQADWDINHASDL